MKVLYLDCASGISGDMTVAALADLGVPRDAIERILRLLPLDGYTVSWNRALKCGISAERFHVALAADEHELPHGAHGHEHAHDKVHAHDHVHDHDQNNDHNHDHAHDHSHEHRSMADIAALLDGAPLPAAVRKIALDVFQVIAEAEGKIHGKPPRDVHFHEVGAVDSIVDIVAAAFCVDWLKPDKVVFSRLREGQGFVMCQHGRMPVPAPATLDILRSCGAPVDFTDTRGEMITPTGAGLVAALGHEFGALYPSGRVLAVGYGAGHKDFEHPNVLRAVLVDTETEGFTDMVCVLEATVDDCTGEALSYALDVLRDNDVKECYFTHITMKKGRPGVLLTVLCPPDREQEVAELIFRHTTTIGLRRHISERHVMERQVQIVLTPYGEIPVKVSRINGVKRVKPEFEAVRALAGKAGVTLEAVGSAAIEAYSQAETVLEG